jgi:hypothetical protein
MRKLLKRGAAAVLIGAPLAVLLALALAIQRQPAVQGTPRLTPALVGRAERTLRQLNPRRARSGQVRTVQIEGDDLNLMANYAASRASMAMEVAVADRHAIVRTSVPIAWTPFGRYLNISAVVNDSEGVPHPTGVVVGRLPIPDRLANWLLRKAIDRVYHPDGQRLATDTIRSVSMRDGRVFIEYAWTDDAQERIRAMSVAAADAARLRTYHERLAATVNALPASRRSLVDLLVPLFALAKERSIAGADLAAENRAALVVLTFYVNGVGMAAVVSGAETWPRARRHPVLLRGRDDLTKHFLVSAVLSATAGTPLAYVVGVYKEIDDSQGGSGFSFSDIAADRAGTLFGQLAVADAAGMQARTSGGLDEADLMPDVTGLVDNMPEADFVQRFEGVGKPSYERVIQEIDRRIAECRLYRPQTP